MADDKISIDTWEFTKLVWAMEKTADAFRNHPEVFYRGRLPYVGAHERLMGDVELMLKEYADLIERDCKRFQKIAITFVITDLMQNGIL